MFEPPVLTTGVIREATAHGLYRTTLPNGKPVLAHLSKIQAQAHAHFEPGDRVTLEMTPYDFDVARITGLAGAAEEEATGQK